MLKNSIKYMALASLLSAPAMAGETPKTVVELFTSQGCSSCPPANKFVGSLKDDPDKLVLSYGVTYWDYLGWKDSFGDPEFTKRQKEYGESLGIGYVYTPQIVLNGTAHNSRYSRENVDGLEQAEPFQALDLNVVGDELVVETDSETVVLVTYTPGWQSIDVKKGENGGRVLKIANVVDSIDLIKGSGVTNVKPKPGKAYAALIHDPETHRIIGASVVAP